MKRNILFITGTRADYGKIKSLMLEINKCDTFDLHIFVTGMHMLSKYGETHKELAKDGFTETYKYINQTSSTSMDLILSSTIEGISNYVHENKVDLIVVHGDRLEALSGAIVGAFNNIKVAHIEGGEISGTIDESIRHAVSKLSHFHFVANAEAKKRLVQLGEIKSDIFIIGSPDIDVMLSNSLPSIDTVKDRYEIPYDEYAILMYHPVTTEVDQVEKNAQELVKAIVKSKRNYVVIYPNNDSGSNDIISVYKAFEEHDNIRVYKSIRFEYFLTLLKHADFIIGNSSAGIREAEVYQVPSIDIGSRQSGRYVIGEAIQHAENDSADILSKINTLPENLKQSPPKYGTGNSAQEFLKILNQDEMWNLDVQKKFVDINF